MLFALLALQLAATEPPPAIFEPSPELPVVCLCPPRGVGGAPEPPLARVLDTAGEPSLIACGDLVERFSPERAKAEEVAVYACGTAEPVLALSPLEAAEVDARADGIDVLELASWPFGTAGAWIDVPVWKSAVAIFADLGPRIERTLAFVPPRLSAGEIRAAIEAYTLWLRAPDSIEEPEAMAGRVLAAALSGNAVARQALASWNADRRVDDELSETWTDASQLYQAYAAATGKVPPLEGKAAQ